jgi:hypothetical protein
MEINKETHQVTESPYPAPYSSPYRTETHSVLRVELSGHALLLTLGALILCILCFHPSLTATIIALAPVPYIIHNDYKAFLSLGPGGTPSTFPGYCKVAYLRMFALKDPYTPPPVLGTVCPSTGRFQSAWLPKRVGPRPTVAGIAPQRQIDQIGCPKANTAFRQALIIAADDQPDRLRVGTSCFEKKGLALFALKPLNPTCRGEICHVHFIDRSLHLNLHPLDAKVVLESGWGQRHPLAKGGWLSKFVPREFLMIYAPRNMEECEVVARIVEAAAWWVTGERFDVNLHQQGERVSSQRLGFNLQQQCEKVNCGALEVDLQQQSGTVSSGRVEVDLRQQGEISKSG